MLAKLMSPDSSASAASAMNWTLVNPVSKVNGSWIATSTAFGFIIMPSNVARAAMMPHWLVRYALCAQSYCGSLPSSSCGKYRLIWV